MPTQSEMTRLSAAAMARSFVDDACRARHGSLTRAAMYAQWFIAELRDAGLPDHAKTGNDIYGTLSNILDTLAEAHGSITRAADAEGIAPECFPLDTAELDALWRHLDASKPRALRERVAATDRQVAEMMGRDPREVARCISKGAQT